jgi:hypothetical protein
MAQTWRNAYAMSRSHKEWTDAVEIIPGFVGLNAEQAKEKWEKLDNTTKGIYRGSYFRDLDSDAELLFSLQRYEEVLEAAPHWEKHIDQDIVQQLNLIKNIGGGNTTLGLLKLKDGRSETGIPIHKQLKAMLEEDNE